MRGFGSSSCRWLVFPTYPATGLEDLARQSGRLRGDVYFGGNARYAAATAQASGQPTFFYFFTRTPPGKEVDGAYHGSEIPFVFNYQPPLFPRNDYDAELADRMGGYWVRFAETGNPNHEGAPDWPAYDPAEPRWMEFGEHTGAKPVERVAVYDISDAQRARVLAEVEP